MVIGLSFVLGALYIIFITGSAPALARSKTALNSEQHTFLPLASVSDPLGRPPLPDARWTRLGAHVAGVHEMEAQHVLVTVSVHRAGR